MTDTPPAVLGTLRCPRCRSPLHEGERELYCANSTCQACFPFVNGIPILINDKSSIFRIADFTSGNNTTFNLKGSRIIRLIKQLLPDISHNIPTKTNYHTLARLLLDRSKAPTVLVVGGSIRGSGMETLDEYPQIQLIETDVSFGPRTQLICDCHDLPFADGTFDGVIAQAVLEHVADPWRAVAEIHRVLKPDGFVYAETPFLQATHMGACDFTRFTHVGHRRLFRSFTEIASGPVAGPGTALAWTYSFFIQSFFRSTSLRLPARAFTLLSGCFLKYFDYLVIRRPGAIDAASGFYFLGRKSDTPIADRDLLTYYRGQSGLGY
ncbi:MAG: methyltransferase domain-containing protein [bacterium]|nr:methyltransferase domain-containing protein [bacterium]